MTNGEPEQGGAETEVVQSVVSVKLADEIRKDAEQQDRTVSKVIALILKGYYAKRAAKPARRAA